MKAWTERVEELEREGCTRSDAQGIADMEVFQGIIKDDNEVSIWDFKQLKLWGGRV